MLLAVILDRDARGLGASGCTRCSQIDVGDLRAGIEGANPWIAGIVTQGIRQGGAERHRLATDAVDSSSDFTRMFFLTEGRETWSFPSVVRPRPIFLSLKQLA